MAKTLEITLFVEVSEEMDEYEADDFVSAIEDHLKEDGSYDGYTVGEARFVLHDRSIA